MSWGSGFFYYHCPSCGKKFKYAVEDIPAPSFGVCPACRTEGELIGESGGFNPPDANDYEDTAD